ncbi:unnamed protein product [marine sediment metagenome]|uniref:Uncharacterized protein n=1 Tax=marine sediment metagenome TaxID=412755 RepID=X0U8Q7_9ZZZZ
MKPCKTCKFTRNKLDCGYYGVGCPEYIAYLKRVRERIRYERFADPQERGRSPVWCKDEREV